MNKAKTLKRNLGNPQPFLSVAWDTEDIPSQVSINLTLKWRDIDWRRAMKNVFKLQKLIYRASSCGKIRKMPRYQKLLTKSYYPLLLTVRWVRQDNQVKNTVGVDGIKNLPPMQRFNFVYLLKSHSLKTSLNPRVSILKQGLNAKFSLGIPTMYDRALQGLVKLSMEPEWEERFEPNSYRFRLGRSTNDAIEVIFSSIKNKSKYFLDADISKCFDLINHDALLGKIKKSSYRRLIKQCLKSRFLDNNQLHPPQQLLFTYPDSFLLGRRWGLVELDTAQGKVMSPLLANITLHGMEKRLIEFAKTLDLKNKKGAQMSWQSKCQSLILVGYVDEFVILQEDIKVLLQAKTVMQEWLNQVRLELKQELIRIANALEEYKGNKPGLDFFGFTMRQGQAKIAKLGFQTLIKSSARSIKTHYRKLAERCDSYKIA
ncbi:MAG: reverse transcriptase N-terminal domain-containing protein, partial [Trichodesmium sp. St18_bin3_1_1]|nr:reverse transcriptase N-terminal domain-containing protein [Trichodesmium sp. St18_bin3_1_1]